MLRAREDEVLANLPKHTIPIDKKFFTKAFADAGLSQNKVAAELGLDRGAMSLLINGKRRMKTEEVMQLSTLLNLPVEKVIAKSGSLNIKK